MKHVFVFVFVFFALSDTIGQINDSIRDELSLKLTKDDISELRIADNYFKDLEYLMALPVYEKLYEKTNDSYLAYMYGCCCAFEAHSYSKAETLILKAKVIKNLLSDFNYYYGKSLQNNEKYELAKNEFQEYLKLPIPKTIKNYVLHSIETCDNNIQSKNKIIPIKIKNIGDKINTSQSEYSPVFASDESFMLYTYRGEKSIGGKQSLPGKKSEKGIYFEDIYVSKRDSLGNFSKGEPIKELNSKTHESASYITTDGRKIYLYKNINGSGEIYFSKKGVDEKWSKPERLNGICSNHWEGSCYFTPDEKTIYFSSDRPGGLGGRDIWKSKLLDNGTFEKPVNVGAPINTSSDEDTPYITSDGKVFYFSSNDSKKSIGGYDIFKADIINGNTFGEPENIGKPLNTIQDDKYLIISPNGKKAYYSSEHLDGLGQQDIYEIDRATFEKPVALIQVSGCVTYEGKPVESKILANPDIGTQISKLN